MRSRPGGPVAVETGSRYYRVYGRCLRSDLDLPDLHSSASQAPAWYLRVADSAPPDTIIDTVGEHSVGRWWYRLYRTDVGLRLVFAQNYVFDLVGDGGEIVWYANERATAENVRAVLLGPVLCLANEMSGALCLHGSAVAIGSVGVGFLAARQRGKSTLALALTLAGARFLSDDAIALDLQEPTRVWPGVQSVRLWSDSARALRAGNTGGVLLDGHKHTLVGLPEEWLQTESVRLGAIYILQPVRPGWCSVPLQRVQLGRADATAMLSCHTKLPHRLVGVAGAVQHLQLSAAIASQVPIYRLEVVRDFERLNDILRLLLDWHRSSDAQHHAPSSH